MHGTDLQQVYSIDIKNRYHLGYDDDDDDTEEVQDLDPFDTLQKIEEEKQRERELKKLSKTKALTTKKTQKKDKDTRTALTKKDNGPVEGQDRNNAKSNNQDRRQRQGDRQYPKGNDENRRPPRRRFDNRREGGRGGYRGEGDNGEQAPVLEGVAKPEGMPERSERYRGSRGGYRGGRGGYGGRGGKREFDRRSGNAKSGVRPTDKRDGGGSRNWGTPGKEIDDASQEKTDEFGTWGETDPNATEATEKKEETTAEGGDQERVVPEEEKLDEEIPAPEPEEVEITYDEWKAQQDKKDKPEFNIRRPGEGEDDERWGTMKVVTKKADEVVKPVNTSETHKRQTRPAHVDMDIRFRSEPGRGGGRGRGGRGRGRGRGGRGRDGDGRGGGPRSDFSSYENRTWQNEAPDVQNESEFPTLA